MDYGNLVVNMEGGTRMPRVPLSGPIRSIWVNGVQWVPESSEETCRDGDHCECYDRGSIGRSTCCDCGNVIYRCAQAGRISMAEPVEELAIEYGDCTACDGRGGFNFFDEYQGDGTNTYTVHRWVTCSLCAKVEVTVDE